MRDSSVTWSPMASPRASDADGSRSLGAEVDRPFCGPAHSRSARHAPDAPARPFGFSELTDVQMEPSPLSNRRPLPDSPTGRRGVMPNEEITWLVRGNEPTDANGERLQASSRRWSFTSRKLRQNRADGGSLEQSHARLPGRVLAGQHVFPRRATRQIHLPAQRQGVAD